jgi:hypothetical protein
LLYVKDMKKQVTDTLAEDEAKPDVASTRKYFLPTEEATVEAADPGEAVELNKTKKDEEVGDDIN